MAQIFDNMNKPAPRWYRILNGIIGDAEDLFLTIWLVSGHTADAPTMIYYKVISSFVRRQLNRVITNGEVYAKPDTITTTETKTTEITATDTTKQPDKIDTKGFPYDPPKPGN